MKNAKVKFILLWTLIVTSFLFFATVLILEAYGYRLDVRTWRIEPTGTIIIDGLPRQAQLRVNNELKPEDLPVKLAKLLPGAYEISLSRNNYQTWSKTFNLQGGQAIEIKRVLLFLNEPKPAETTRNLALAELQKNFLNQSQPIKMQGNEIWYQEKLVTRFSALPTGAILTNERNHIIFQLGRELRVMDLDGTNNFRLITLYSDETVAFALFADNLMLDFDKLVWAEGGKIWEAEIR